EKEEYYNLGKKILKDFYKDYKENPPKVLRINNEPALELPFNLKIGEYSLYGVIDRIDEGGQIIDYKTGKAKDKIQTEDKAQLLIYQMAAEEVLGIKPKELTYYYLETGKKISFLGSEKDKSERKEKIIQAIKAIKESSFEPTPGWQCEFCDFKDVCDFKNV
ncbi:PD-(D/E)XK nuclease family protein, partial [Patescibacteria group bacterium]|nr:PD-(D/E)XK nuclease family protein [Patescibacteria group bacterium]